MNKTKKWGFKDYFLVIFGGLFLAFSRFNFARFVVNFDYSLLGLRLFNPSFIINDWFVWKVPNISYAFAYLLYFLQKTGHFEQALTIAEITILIILSLALMMIIKRYCRYPIAIFLLIIVWLRIVNANEIGLGGQYFIKGFLQPLEIAGPLMILGFAFLLNYQYLFSGITLGLAGLFHGAYLSSFGPAILAASLVMGVWKKAKYVIVFVIPLAVLWGLFIYFTKDILITSGSLVKDSMSLIVNLRAANDFMIKNWSLKWNVVWTSWAILGTAAVLTLPQEKKFNQLKTVFFTILITNIFGVLQLIFIKHPTLTLMMFWRSSFLVLILGLIMALDKAINLFFKQKLLKKDKQFLIIALFVFLGLSLISWGPHISRIHFLWLISIPLAAFIANVLKNYQKISTVKSAVFFAVIYLSMTVIMGAYINGYFGKSKEFLSEYSPRLIETQNWIKKNIPEDAILIIPPDIPYMRTRSRRAIVVDWLSVPYSSSFLYEWYERLCTISGLDPNFLVSSFSDIMNGYYRLDTVRAKKIRKRYNADYLIIETQKHKGNLAGLVEVFSNEEYGIYKISNF